MSPVKAAEVFSYSIEAYGETAVIVLTGAGIDEKAYHRLSTLSAMIKNNPAPGFLELVPGYDSLLFIFDPLVTDSPCAIAAIESMLAEAETGKEPVPGEIVELPVAYGGNFGPDLEALAIKTRLSSEEIIALHCARPYLVYMLGFTPGFPYLGGLDPRIAAPRLSTPRTRVPAGSVGIADSQTGVYPLESPGGWNIIGRTPLKIFDSRRPEPALLAAGRYVRFVPISEEIYADLLESSHKPPHSRPFINADTSLHVTVIKPGALSCIQDLGRFGFQDSGVPPAGPMDSLSMRLANMLAGNPPEAACIECTLGGLELQFDNDTVIAVTGAVLPVMVDGIPVPQNRNVRVKKGSLLALGTAEAGLRAYVAIQGGLLTDPAMGSRATFVRGGFGGLNGRNLTAGNCIPVDGEKQDHNIRTVPDRILPRSMITVFSDEIKVRAIASHESDRFIRDSLASFFSQTFRVSPKSDRMGCRLEGIPLAQVHGADIVSSGVLTGTVQVPGDGQPIVLMADRQTTGGYTRIAHVIQADLHLLGQARPGTRVRFGECGIDEAREALITREKLLDEFQRKMVNDSQDPVSRDRRRFHITIDGISFDTFVEELS